jgi:hypothetical protein
MFLDLTEARQARAARESAFAPSVGAALRRGKPANRDCEI